MSSDSREYRSHHSVRSFFWPSDEQRIHIGGVSFELNYASWLIRLRWLAIIVILGLAVLNTLLLHYVEEAPMLGIWATVSALVVLNVIYSVSGSKSYFWTHTGLMIQVALDMIVLTVLLHFSGGLENPMSFAYVFHVILGSIIFNRRTAFCAVIFSTILLAVLAFGEFAEIFHHYTIGVFPHFEGELGEQHASHDLLYVSVRVGLHFLFMALSAGFVTALMTRLHRATSEIRNERLKLSHVIESTGIGLAIIHQDSHVEALNPYDRIWHPLGGMADDAVWRLWLNDLSLEAATHVEGEMAEYERNTVTSSGETRHFQLNISSASESAQDEEIRGTVLISEITERKRMAAEMMHSDRITMLGKVSAGIAHEVGNPLASISTRLSILEDCDSLTEIKTGLNPLKEQVARINRIVRGVSQIARPQQGKWGCFDLRKAIDDTIEVIRLHKGAKRCVLESRIPELPMLINGVEDQIEQVFLNLCLNALDAMPNGGELSIYCASDGTNHLVNFSDSGSGMALEQQAHVFDLFYTTKKNGLGIGMHIAYQIVNAHHGTISVTSNPGKGTTFSIALPKTDFQPS